MDVCWSGVGWRDVFTTYLCAILCSTPRWGANGPPIQPPPHSAYVATVLVQLCRYSVSVSQTSNCVLRYDCKFQLAGANA